MTFFRRSLRSVVIFLSLSAVSLNNVHHLSVKQVGWKAADVVARTFCDLTASWTTQRSSTLLSQPSFQTGFAESVKTFQYFRFVTFTKLFLTH